MFVKSQPLATISTSFSVWLSGKYTCAHLQSEIGSCLKEKHVSDYLCGLSNCFTEYSYYTKEVPRSQESVRMDSVSLPFLFKWRSELWKARIHQCFLLGKTFLVRLDVLIMNKICWSWIMECANVWKRPIRKGTNWWCMMSHHPWL